MTSRFARSSFYYNSLFLIFCFSLFLILFSSFLCFFPIQQSFSFIIQFDSQSYHFSLICLERLKILVCDDLVNGSFLSTVVFQL